MYEVKGISHKKNDIKLNTFTKKKLNGLKNYTESIIDNYNTDELKEIYMKEGATIANAYFSMGEGVAKFGGALVDTLASLGSVIDSSVVELFGNHELAERLRSDTQAFVAESYVSNYWDKFYETTSIGSSIKEKSYGFATTRQIGNGIGYTVGVVVTCILTAGVGGALSGGATTVGVASTEMSTIMAAWGGIAGFGKGADEAWREGSGYWTGLGYATLTAGWEALQFYLGGKINGLSLDGPTIKSILARVALDTADGGAEGFVQPFLQSIYRGGYTDPKTGEYIEFGKDSSAWDRYVGMWKEQGGWKGVATNAIIAALMSSTAEAGEFAFRRGETIQGLDQIYKKLSKNENFELNVKQLDLIDTARKQLGLSDDVSSKEVAQTAIDIWKTLDYDKINTKNMSLSTMKKLSASMESLDDISRKEVLAVFTGFRDISELKNFDNFNNTLDTFFDKLTTFDIKNMDEQTSSILKKYIAENYNNKFGSEIKSTDLNDMFLEYRNELSRIGENRNFNLTEIENMSIDEQIDLFRNGDFGVYRKDFDFSTLDDSVKKVVDERILKEQNFLFNQFALNTSSLDYNKIAEYISKNENILSNISNENITRLAGVYGLKNTDLLLTEIMKRVENGEILYNMSTLKFSIPFIGAVGYDTALGYDRIGKKYPEFMDYLREIYKNNKGYIPDDVINVLNLDTRNPSQRILLSQMFLEDRIDDAGVEILKSLEGKPLLINTFDFTLLDKDIISDFGVDFVKNMGRFSELSSKLYYLKENSPNVYEAFLNIVKDSLKDHSLNSYSTKVKLSLNYLFENSADLEQTIKYVDLESLQTYIDMKNSLGYEVVGPFSNNFMNEYIKSLDSSSEKIIDKIHEYEPDPVNRLLIPQKIEELKENIYKKYFNVSPSEAKKFLEKYKTNIDFIESNCTNPDFKKYIEVVKLIDEIGKTDDRNIIIDLYKNIDVTITPEEFGYMDDILRREYNKTYVDAFKHTSDSIQNSTTSIVDIGEKKVRVVEMQDSFSMLVHSSDTGFTEDKILVNNSFKDTFYNTSNPSIHGVATSFISQNNIGCAPVGKNGVLYGFFDLGVNDIKGMGTSDINSNIANYGFSSGKTQKYVIADSMSSETLRLYNEMVLDRDTLVPSCIVLYSDASDDVVQNSFKAAAEWNVPVVKINVDDLAKNQIKEVNSLLDGFKVNEDISLLKKSITLYETGAAGFNINIKELPTEKFSNMHESTKEIYDSCDIEKVCMDYAKKIKLSNDDSKINEFKTILSEIKGKYASLNELNNVISKTDSYIDIESIMEVLNE